MNKIPRFMKEYANFQIKNLKKNKMLNENVKTKAQQKITKTQELYQKGLITITEAMDGICHCFLSKSKGENNYG